MSRLIRHKLQDLSFVGGRFDKNKGWLEFEMLQELLTYKKLIVETAKETWRRKHPGRDRLPRGFEENIRLAFHEIREGSSVVPVERVFEVEEDMLGVYQPDEVDEAAGIINSTILSAEKDEPFPDTLPASIIPIFGEWGTALLPDETIELCWDREDSRARFNHATRERILSRMPEVYEDRVDLIGEIRGAGLRTTEGGSFTIQREDGTTVEGAFNADQETVITDALHKHRSIRVRLIGMAEFERGGRIRKIMKIDQVEARPVGEKAYDHAAPPIWDEIDRIASEIPDSEWAKVPTDLAKNLDHYLYGRRKEGAD